MCRDTANTADTMSILNVNADASANGAAMLWLYSSNAIYRDTANAADYTSMLKVNADNAAMLWLYSSNAMFRDTANTAYIILRSINANCQC